MFSQYASAQKLIHLISTVKFNLIIFKNINMNEIDSIKKLILSILK
jgi:hypothetical protein